MTNGVLKALAKQRHRSVCDDCGFALPVYPGRYPSSCPLCGKSRVPAAPESAPAK